MSDYLEDDIFKYDSIPEVFWSFEKDEPFSHCLVCSENLLVEGKNYFVEKAFNKGEVIFEYAMCLKCRDELSEELSLQSRRLIENYFAEHIDLETRRERLLEKQNLEIDHWLGHCIVKNKPIKTDSEYQVFAQCIGKEMIYAYAPYAVSGEAIDDVIELLSDETLGILGDFTDKYFGIDVPQKLLLI